MLDFLSPFFPLTLTFTAQIGPPEIKLQSINGAIKIKVSPPEANQIRKMWTDHLSFKYNLVIWENSSNREVWSLFSLLCNLNITVRDIF